MTTSEIDLIHQEGKGTMVLRQFSKLRITTPREKFIDSDNLFTLFGTPFHLRVYPNGDKWSSENCISVFLRVADMETRKGEPLWASFSIEAIGKNDKKNTRCELKPMDFLLVVDRGWMDFLDLNTCKNDFLVDDTLTIQVTASSFTKKFEKKYFPDSNGVPAPTVAHSVAAELGDLLESDVGADTKISFCGGERMVHKTVLMARSPVFRQMFASEMKERSTNHVHIPDIHEKALGPFLKFLYMDSLGCKDEDIAEQCVLVLPIASKYEVRSLLSYCAHELASRLTVENAARVLYLADRASLDSLKQATLSFITNSEERFNLVRDTEDFDSLDKDLLHEVITSALSRPKRPRSEALEFADGEDFTRLTLAQLRRACTERGLSSLGNKEMLIARLENGEEI